jgi:hypothetical protein
MDSDPQGGELGNVVGTRLGAVVCHEDELLAWRVLVAWDDVEVDGTMVAKHLECFGGFGQ